MRAAALSILAVAVLLAPAAVGAKGSDPVNPPPSPNEKVFVQFADPKLELGGEVLAVEVLFNPKEVSLDKAVPWQHHRNTEGDSPTLEFTAGQPHSLNVTLMFDGYESQTDVARVLAPLQKVVASPDDRHRPPNVLFQWGQIEFSGVITSLDVHYTLFLPDGTPCRATATLHFSEAKPVEHGHGSGGSGNQTRG